MSETSKILLDRHSNMQMTMTKSVSVSRGKSPSLHENLYLQSKKSYSKSHIYIVFNRLYSYLLKKGKDCKCDLYSYLHTSKCL